MARRTRNGLRLSWHKATKRWYKKIQGRFCYFGSGSSISDRESYRKAVAAYDRYLEEAEERAWSIDVPDRVWRDWSTPSIQPQRRSSEYGSIEEAMSDEDKRRKILAIVNGTPAPQRNRVAEIASTFITECEQRLDMTEAGTAPSSQTMSRGNYYATKSNTTAFVTYVETIARRRTLGDAIQLENLLKGYRDYLVGLMSNGSIATATVNNRLRDCRKFIRWAYQNRHIESEPRNMSNVTASLSVKPNPKPVNIDTIAKVYANADNLLKTFILLGINCAMYESEISSLTINDIYIDKDDNKYIASHRSKTGVPYKIMLWDITYKHITDNGNAEGLLFTSATGNALDKRHIICERLRKLTKQLGVSLTFSQLRDTTATLIERIAEREGMPELTSMILAHSDNRTAKYYASKSPRQIDSSALDKAIVELYESYKEIFK